ncbi:hypothetical protein PHAVU_004G129700 [Phaseolus vulgaris]|uniref:Uncharacterized protein n=1 Tax=Phaseolus vulgaris TaxID=3885 RepID=V7C2P7_PHAVU|nr:hypothetical protein PHAVU_004G129700g [Phaseolus vulgaris]ESW24424.1 hypothetical protein PHAVU_004G129700g [Phaseolus vulgaris]
MKPTAVLALFFLLLLLAFLTNLPLAFSNVQPIVDTNGNPIFRGFTYYIFPAIFGPSGGGLKLAQTGNSKCALTVLQDYSNLFRGIHHTWNPISTRFHIENYHFGYKLVFCITGSPTCLDIGRFDAENGEDGRRLNLTEHEAFDLVFVKVFEADKVIKSVV